MSKQTFRLRNNFILNILFSCSSVSLALFGLLTFVPPYNPEKQAEALIDPDLYTISVNAVSDINLQVNPSAAGTVAMVEDVITSSTNSPSGYKLYVSVDGDHNDIYLNGDSRNDVADKKIAATSGTFDSPSSLMNDSTSSWGYAVPGLSNFDAAYDVTSPSSSAKFAALPVIGEEQLIHEHEGVATDDTTSVYYGAKVDSNIAAGHYIANVVYTSMTDISSITNGELTVSPNDFMENYEPVTITITTSLSTSREIGTVTATVGGNICGDLDIANYDPLTVTCTLPAGLSSDEHNVALNIPRLGKSYEAEDGIKVIAANHTCTKQYRLQNADGTYPDEYIQDPDLTETIAHGETCSYTKAVEDYQEQTATITPYKDTAVSLDLPRNTYELTITHNNFIVSTSGAGTYRWGQEVPVSAVSTGELPFRKWKQKAGTASTFTDETQIETSFIMPKSDATIYADGGSYCDYEPGQEWEFLYTGASEEFVVPCDATYKLEVWGASGGANGESGGGSIGKGGYATGTLALTTSNTLYIGVGGVGRTGGGGWNGGGSGGSNAYGTRGGGGGGATHIATSLVGTGELKNYSSETSSVKIVAAGGGGGGGSGSWAGAGGGLSGANGGNGWPAGSSTTAGGSQTGAGGRSGSHWDGWAADSSRYNTRGGFGYGGTGGSFCKVNEDLQTYPYPQNGGGGGGWYGGGGGNSFNGSYGDGGGGGSSYIDGVTDGSTIAGNASMPTQDGTSTMTGNSGNGYAKITLLED